METNILAVVVILIVSLTTVQCFIDCKGLEFDENHEVKIFTLNQFLKSDGKSSKIVSSGTNLQHLRSGMIDRKQWYQYYIRKVDLSENNVTVIDAEPFNSIKTCLVVIDLSKNKITTINRGAFANLPVLQKLDLSNNCLMALNDEWFDSTTVLKILLLNNNNIIHINSSMVLKSLNILKLKNNNLSLSTGIFKNFPSLIILNLENNSITDLPIGAFEGLMSIEQLLLGFNKINQFKLGSLSGLKSIEILNVSHNSLNQENVAYMLNFPLPNLQSLIIDGNNGKKLNINELVLHMPKIKHIGLGNMSWDCKDLVKVYTQCQKYKIDVLTHVKVNYTTSNVHGIACTENNATTESIGTTSEVPALSTSNDYIDVQTISTTDKNDFFTPTTISSSTYDAENKLANKLSEKINLQQEQYKSSDEKLLSDVKTIGIVLIFFIVILIVIIIFKERLTIMQRKVRHYVQDRVYRNDKIEGTSECDMSLVDNNLHSNS